VKFADMTGDGLQDIVLIHGNAVEYWPNLGHGEWSKRISMRNSPRLPDLPGDYDPKRILLGDVDGDGLADLIYLDDRNTTLWINQSGNSWSEPILIPGTPRVSNMDAIRLADVLGTGVSGVLWTSDATSASGHHMYFLDFTGGVKPYVLHEMNNHMGALTRVEYSSSTRFYLEDEEPGGTPWTTPLPFPVQVVSRVEVIDTHSGGKLTTEYSYHHGYWDGEEREFRGFGRVDQRDTETFEIYNTAGLHEDTEFRKVPEEQFCPPTETRTWFHQGAIENRRGEWNENDFSGEFWPEDPQVLQRDLKALDPPVRREALRALRGRILRTELYGLDSDAQRRKRPYTVTEYAYDLSEIDKPDDKQKDRLPIFFPYTIAQRTTEWERGKDPMSKFQFTDDYDPYGQPQRQTSVACPRGWSTSGDGIGKPSPYLVTRTRTAYASPELPGPYIYARVAKATTCELSNDGKQKLEDLQKLPDDDPAWNLIGQTANYYDGEAFKGLGLGRVGAYGALVRNESLVLTEGILADAYKTGIEVQNPPELPTYLRPDGPPAWDGREYPDDFQNLPLFDRSMDPTRPEFPVVVAGYGFSSGEGSLARGYWSATERRSYDFQNGAGHRGLVVARRDPLGHETGIVYNPDDPYAMFPAEVRDEVKLTTRADYDLRVFQPRRITDPNDNVTEYAFTPLGLLRSIQLKGKLSRNTEGDKQQPSTEFEYSILNSPASVRTIRHVHHDTEAVADAKRDETIETVEYSDGFGRLLQTRTQAEEGGMVGWWRFAEQGGSTAFDSSGAENHGTLSGGVAFVNDPVFGWVIDFTAADGAMLVPHKPELEPPTGTISVWVKVGVLQNADVIMKTTDWWVRTNLSGSFSVIGLRIREDGGVDGLIGNNDPITPPNDWRSARTAPNMMKAGEWCHLTLRWDGKAVAVFVNGALQESTEYYPVPGAGLSYHNGSALGFCVWTSWGEGSEGYQFIGKLADARYYARARTDTEIWNDFANARKSNFGEIGVRTARPFAPQQTYPVKGQSRVVVSGCQTYDNKGRLVEKFEPFFSTGWKYVPPRDEEYGKKVSMYYDPRGHVIRTENPDGSMGQVVYGIPGTIVEPDLGNPDIFEPTPWETYTYDPNDNAGRTQQSLAYAEHWNTPASATTDALGRTVEAVERDAMIRITVLSAGEQSNSFWFSVGPPHAAGLPVRGGSAVANGPVIKELSPPNVAAGGPDFLLTVTGSGFDPNAVVQWNGSGLETVFISAEQLTATVRAKDIATATLYITRSVYDIRGNLLRVVDPLGREAFRHVYDLANRPWRIESIDAGLRRIVLDAAGNEIERRDAKGALTLRGYDVLNRPARLWARDQAAGEVTLREQLTYGDGGDANQSDAERALKRQSNLLGRLQEHYDEAGLLTFEDYDFKGNLLHKERRVFTDEAIRNDRTNWEPSDGIPGDRLEETAYRTSTAYDALNHIVKEQYPLDVSGTRKEVVPRYNRAGALVAVDLDGKPFVQQIVSNAKGQRTFIAYGNNVVTRYTYDPKTFRLTAMRTDGCDHPADDAYAAVGPRLQDYTYSYDLVGNILTIQDSTPGSGVQDSAEGRDRLTRCFTYDPLYRLTSATGRECKTAKPRPWTDDPRCGFDSFGHGTVDQNNAPNETALYIEEYACDGCGNMIKLKHTQGADSWRRYFGIGDQTARQWDQTWRDRLARDQRGEEWIEPPGKKLPGNQLTCLGDDDPNLGPTHYFDATGNVVRENGNRYFDWDYRDRMRAFRVQAVAADPSVRADYLYDSAGQRVKKLVSKGNGKQTESTVYIDGMFEHHRWLTDNAAKENNWLHVMDNQSRIAMRRIGDAYSGDPGPEVQYHLGDHLGSSTLVMGGDGDQINREEYFPYGETSFGSFAKKRYRFTGKERDEESGLYYYGARYYAPWLARWTSCDPNGLADGPNSYTYVRAAPTRLIDPSGRESYAAMIERKKQSAATAGLLDANAGLGPPKWFSASDRVRYEADIADRQSIDKHIKYADMAANVLETVLFFVLPELAPALEDAAAARAVRLERGAVPVATEDAAAARAVQTGEGAAGARSVAQSPTPRVFKVQQPSSMKPSVPEQIRSLSKAERAKLDAITDQVERAGLARRRGYAVQEAWKTEREALLRGEPGSRQWGPQQRIDIEQGKIPQFEDAPMQGHHGGKVEDFPEVAGDSDNIVFRTRREHIYREHGGDPSLPTQAVPRNPRVPKDF
jgi:RHS repeat-associated protein